MYCAQFLACLIDCFFAFWLCICIRLFALFFPIVWCIPSCVLLSNFADSLFLHFAGFSVVPHPRLQCQLVPSIRFFLRHISYFRLFLGPDVYYVVLIHFLAVFLLSSVLAFLLHKSVVMHQVALARFAFV